MRIGIVIGFARALLVMVSIELAAASCGSEDPPPQGGEVGGSSLASGGAPGVGGGGSADPGESAGSENGGDTGEMTADASVSGPGDARVVDSPVYVADRGANPQGILFHVKNNCPFELWMHGGGKEGVLQPDNAPLMTGDTQDYIAPDEWTAARLTAYGSAPNAKGEP